MYSEGKSLWNSCVNKHRENKLTSLCMWMPLTCWTLFSLCDSRVYWYIGYNGNMYNSWTKYYHKVCTSVTTVCRVCHCATKIFSVKYQAGNYWDTLMQWRYFLWSTIVAPFHMNICIQCVFKCSYIVSTSRNHWHHWHCDHRLHWKHSKDVW